MLPNKLSHQHTNCHILTKLRNFLPAFVTFPLRRSSPSLRNHLSLTRESLYRSNLPQIREAWIPHLTMVVVVLVEIRRLPRRMLLRSVHVLDETRFQTPASYGSLPKQPARSKMLHRIPPSRKAAFSRCSCLQSSFLVLPVLCSGRILYGRQLPLQAALSLCYVLLRMLWIKLPYDLI